MQIPIRQSIQDSDSNTWHEKKKKVVGRWSKQRADSVAKLSEYSDTWHDSDSTKHNKIQKIDTEYRMSHHLPYLQGPEHCIFPGSQSPIADEISKRLRTNNRERLQTFRKLTSV
jgi:hypothetical protein